MWVVHQRWAQKHNQSDQKLKINFGLRPWVEKTLGSLRPNHVVCALQRLRPGQRSGVEVGWPERGAKWGQWPQKE